MKSKKITFLALVLALVAVCAVGVATSFAAEANPQVEEPTAVVQELSAKTKDWSAKTGKTDKTGKAGKTGMSFVGIDAVAADVLGVSEESLARVNHADQLYAELVEAGKVDEFKTALIAAKQAQYDAKASMGKFSAGELAEKLAGYTQTINAWDGTTELVVSSAKTKAK